MTAVLICHFEDIERPENTGPKVLRTIQTFWKERLGREPEEVEYKQRCQGCDLKNLISPRLVILHINNPERRELETQFETMGTEANPRIYVTNGAEESIFSDSPCLSFNGQDRTRELYELLEIWFGEQNQDCALTHTGLLRAWTSLPGVRRQRLSGIADGLLLALASIDILVQGYLAIRSDEAEWKELRALPGVAENADAAKQVTEAHRLWRPMNEVQAMVSPFSEAPLAPSGYWFDAVIPEVCPEVFRGAESTRPFTEAADESLEEIANEVLSDATSVSQEHFATSVSQEHFKALLFSSESNRAAMMWVDYLLKGSAGAVPPQGALRLCWELVKGGGQFAQNDLTSLRPESLCGLFEAAHREYLQCYKFLSSLHHE